MYYTGNGTASVWDGRILLEKKMAGVKVCKQGVPSKNRGQKLEFQHQLVEADLENWVCGGCNMVGHGTALF